MDALGLTALAVAAQDMAARFELTPPPEVRIALPGELLPAEWARSVLYESGREVILIAADALSRADLPLILDHEASHLKAWRLYGPGIETHGREFRRVCRKYARDRAACEIDH